MDDNKLTVPQSIKDFGLKITKECIVGILVDINERHEKGFLTINEYRYMSKALENFIPNISKTTLNIAIDNISGYREQQSIDCGYLNGCISGVLGTNSDAIKHPNDWNKIYEHFASLVFGNVARIMEMLKEHAEKQCRS